MTRTVIDALGRAVVLEGLPRRIVSLVPSQTELLADLGLDQEVVGLTRYCIHPKDWLGRKAVVGGTKKARFEKVEALAPDLILANKEENTQKDVGRLEALAPVYVTDVHDLPQSYGHRGQPGSDDLDHPFHEPRRAIPGDRVPPPVLLHSVSRQSDRGPTPGGKHLRRCGPRVGLPAIGGRPELMIGFVKRAWGIMRRPAAHYSLGALTIGGFVMGVIFWGGFNTALEATNTEKFCISCHEMRENVFAELQEPVHYTNASGVRATCPDCHVPHNWTRRANAPGFSFSNAK